MNLKNFKVPTFFNIVVQFLYTLTFLKILDIKLINKESYIRLSI